MSDLAWVWRERVADAFRAGSAERHRGPYDLGVSALGGCTRAAAYAIARVDPSDVVQPGEGRSANLGTAEHEWLLPRLAGVTGGAVVEVEVVLRAAGLEIPGHVDLSVPDVDVVDLKTVAEHRLQRVRRLGGPYPDHRLQEAGYGLALLQAGHTPKHLVTIYMDRADGDVEVFVERFTSDHVSLVVDRVSDLVEWSEDPDAAPREDCSGRKMVGPGPAGSFACNECWWLKRCWGEFAQPGTDPGIPMVESHPAILAALEQYERGRAMESDGKAVKAEAARLLDGVKHGGYGDFMYSRGRGSEVPDDAAAVELLRQLGYEVPMKQRSGALSVRRVKAAKKDDDGQ